MRLSGPAAVLLVLVVAATGCDGASKARSAPSHAVTSAAAGASGSPGPVPVPSPATATLIEFGRQGGLAGFDDTLTIRPDGSYQVTRRGGDPVPGKLGPDDLARLRQALDGAHFADIPAVNPAATPVADGFTYRVAYGGHEVLAQDGGVPPALAPVLDALAKVLNG